MTMDNNVKKQKKFRRSLRSGSYVFTVSVILAAVLVLVNLVASALPAAYLKYDMTASGIFSVGDTTRQVLDTVSDDIKIYQVYESGNSDDTVTSFLERYEGLSSHIKVSHVDPGVDPTFVSSLTDESVSSNYLIVVGPKRTTVVDYNDLYKYYVEQYDQYMSYSEYSQYRQYMYAYGQSVSGTPFFFGEQEITSAIDYVTTDTLPVVYYTSKHGEATINSTYTEAIADENIDLRELDMLSSASIPDDAEAIIIYAPTMDFSDSEAELIIDYITSGGNVMLFTGYDSDVSTALPNIAKICDTMGLSAEDGTLIEDASHYQQAQYITFPALNASSVPASLMKSTNVSIVAPFAHGIVENENAQYTVTPILTSSSNAFIKKNPDDLPSKYITKSDNDVEGEFLLGAHVSVTSDDSTDTGSFVWYSSYDLLNVNPTQYGNSDLFISTLNSMCEKSTSISIIGKSLDSGYLTMDAVESSLWRTVITVIVPGAVLIGGFCVWYRRRHK